MTSHMIRHKPVHRRWLFAMAAMFFAAGCTPRDIDATYGRRRGYNGANSVDGTAVLADMFQQAGHKVISWKRLSPKLEQSQVIVWAPDDFDPPTLKQREYLEKWLSNQRGRTLVYIGRDFDAAPLYWTKMQNQVPAPQAVEVARRRAKTQAEHDQSHISMPKEKYARWFVARRDSRKKVQVRTLEGPWSGSVDAAGVEIQLEGRFDPPLEKDIPAKPTTVAAPPTVAVNPKGAPKRAPKFLNMGQDVGTELRYLPQVRPLLKSGEDVIVSEVTEVKWGDSKVIVVTNGSFLLNLPLVNREHRKLAGQLIAACGPAGRTTFLESGQLGLQILDEETDGKQPTGLELFTVWPLNLILLHLVAVGILYCFARFPIFGRPRTLPPDTVSDFAQHLQAVSELLEKSGDQQYARDRLNYYHQHVKRDSGVSHKANRVTGGPGSVSNAPAAPPR